MPVGQGQGSCYFQSEWTWAVQGVAKPLLAYPRGLLEEDGGSFGPWELLGQQLAFFSLHITQNHDKSARVFFFYEVNLLPALRHRLFFTLLACWTLPTRGFHPPACGNKSVAPKLPPLVVGKSSVLLHL